MKSKHLLWAGGILLGLVCLVAALNLRRLLWHLPEALRPASMQSFGWRYENTMFPDTTPSEVGHGGPAREARFREPMGIAEGPAGDVYVADRGHYVWRIDPQGRAWVVAGTGRQGRAETGIDARESDLGIPEGLRVDPQGRVLFADSRNNSILRIELDGKLTRVAGNGRRGNGGNGEPAPHAMLDRPFDLALDSKGSVYVADFGNHRIGRIDASGRIESVAGTGEPGYSGDGGPAVRARLNEPYGIAVDGLDRLLIADSANHVIRRIDADGIITTIAGAGRPGFAGDGGPAAAALFNSPQSLFVDASGRLYVNDEHNHAIRVIEPDGTVSTLIGDGTPGAEGDGGPASRARLNDPENLIVRRDGSILVTDGDSRRIRLIAPNGRAWTYAGGSLLSEGSPAPSGASSAVLYLRPESPR